MIRFVISFFWLFIGSLFIYGQSPGSEIDFGRYNGKLDEEPVAKSPKNRTYYPLEETGKLHLSKAKVHYSRVFKGDTTSMSYNGYFIEFNHAHIYNEAPDFTYYSDYVTNEDWNLFRKYVLDSIARRILGEQKSADKWLLPTTDILGDTLDEGEWILNWKTKLNYKKEPKNSQYPYLAQMFYCESERLNGKLLLDEREIMYEFYWIDLDSFKASKEAIPIEISNDIIGKQRYDRNRYWKYSDYFIKEIGCLYRDSVLWIKDSSSLHFGNIEDGIVTYYNWHEQFETMPVVGISQPQARAYLNWLQWNHNIHLDNQKIPYYVIYELPQFVGETPPKVEIPAFELSPWRISNAQYKEFVEYVRDSTARRILGEEWIAEGYLSLTYDVEGQESDLEDCLLDWKGKIDWDRKSSVIKRGKKEAPYGLIKELYYPQCCGDTNLIDKRKLNYVYYFIDFKSASVELPKKLEGAPEMWYDTWREFCKHKPYARYLSGVMDSCYNGIGQFCGKNFNLSYTNRCCDNTDVFSHEDRSAFIIRDIINIYPTVEFRDIHRVRSWYRYDNSFYDVPCQMFEKIENNSFNNIDQVPEEYDFDTNPDAPVQGINYAQFRAYWWWYNRERRKEIEGNPVIADYIPSKEEFIQLQQGESVIHPKEVHELPTPTFNYVMKFYRIQPSTNN